MKQRQKKTALFAAGGLGLLMIAALRHGKGQVSIGPVTVRTEAVNLGPVTDAEVQRLSLAIARSRNLMGADPNTLASRKPSPEELTYIEQMLTLARSLSERSGGGIPLPTAEQRRLDLALRLPGNALQQANAQFYAALGIDALSDNTPTIPLTPATDTIARSAIAKWRPYSQEAVDTLFVLLDDARQLGGDA